MFRNSNDPIEYTYYGYDKRKEKSFRITLRPGDAKEGGGKFTEKEIIILRDSDHRMQLEDRYWEECKSESFEMLKDKEQDGDFDDSINPVENIRNFTDNNPSTILTTETDSPASANDTEAAIQRLTELIKTLSAEERALLDALYSLDSDHERMSMRSYAKEIGISEGTVRNRHKRLLQKLKNLF